MIAFDTSNWLLKGVPHKNVHRVDKARPLTLFMKGTHSNFLPLVKGHFYEENFNLHRYFAKGTTVVAWGTTASDVGHVLFIASSFVVPITCIFTASAFI